MLSDVQSRKIAKYRKLAAKNKFCRYLAVFLLIWSLFWSKFLSFHRRKIVILTELCLVVAIFAFSTSFAPPVFTSEADNSETYTASVTTEFYLEDDGIADDISEEEYIEEYGSIDVIEDTASLEDLIETNKSTVIVEDTPKANDEAVFHKDDWNILLVNKQHTIPEDYEFTLGTIKGSMRCDERIIEPLTQMFAAAKEDGVNLIVCSPYRDMARQEYLFDRKVKSFIRTGMSYVDAYKKASITVTVPGASEHQIGLAVDLISDTYSALDIGFADTAAGQWLAENSWEYGFILRYPLGKEEITGIQYEPWHFRYVGVDAAKIITEKGITLEEFVENL